MRAAGGSWTSFFERALDFLYPRKCPLCGLLSSASPCAACYDEFKLSDPFLMTLNESESPLAYRAAKYRYEGRAAQAVRRLKYGRSTSLTEVLANDFAGSFERLGFEPDLVAPVPIHWGRRMDRGFNQSDLLSSRLPNVDRSALIRVRRTRPQVGLSREERQKNIKGAFRASPAVVGKHVLLVDDVFTSGHTARECALALREAGAVEVGILTLCAGDK